MSWYYLDINGNTSGPVPAHFILSKYHFKTGEITSVTKIWNVERGVEQWTELKRIYFIIAKDIILSIPQGIITKNLLSAMMNPYHIYICKTKHSQNTPLPIGEATVEIEYVAYFANVVEYHSNTKSLSPFMHNRESVMLGVKHNPYGVEITVYKMHESEQCFVYIPWRLAYGEQGAMNLKYGEHIPPKTDILFNITLHRIEQQGTSWQHNKTRFDKWSKKREKWISQKRAMNQLHIKDNYEMAPVQNIIKKLPKKPTKQPILPMETKKKLQTNSLVLPNTNGNNVVNGHKLLSREERWSTTATSGAEFKKITPKKKKSKKRKSSKLRTPPLPPRHRISQSDGGLAEELTAKLQSKQLHRRTVTGYGSNASIHNTNTEDIIDTFMGRLSNRSEAELDHDAQTVSTAANDDEKKTFHIHAAPVRIPESEPEPLSVYSPTIRGTNTSSALFSPTESSQLSRFDIPMTPTVERSYMDSALDWENWLRGHKIPPAMITKLVNGGILSWDELHAIGDDVEEVSQELGLSALHKIKLKALMRKLPLRPIPSDKSKRSAITEFDEKEIETFELETVPSGSDHETEEVISPLSPSSKSSAKPIKKKKKKKKKASSVQIPITQTLENKDDVRYLKSQIDLLKAENFRLHKLSDENESKQEIMDAEDALYAKDLEIKTLQKQLDEKNVKLWEKELECEKLSKLLRVKDRQTYVDLHDSLYTNCCEAIHHLLDTIACSESQLDEIASQAIDDLKTMLNDSYNEDELETEANEKRNDLVESKENVRQILQQLMTISHDDNNDNNDYDAVMLLRAENSDDLIKQRQIFQVSLSANIDNLLNTINPQKARFEEKLSRLTENKYNELFYRYFVSEISIMFYDLKLIRSQFTQNAYDKKRVLLQANNVLCENGEKLLFSIPLTMKLLSVIVRNEESEMNLFYDVLCLDHFTQNMISFETDFIASNVSSFSSILAVHLIESATVQNVIESSKKSQRKMTLITDSLKKKVTQFKDHLMCLIATGCCANIVYVLQDTNVDIFSLLANLCLLHPKVHKKEKRKTSKQLKNAVKKEKLNKILDEFQIEIKELKLILTDYFTTFGSVEFMKNIIENARETRKV